MLEFNSRIKTTIVNHRITIQNYENPENPKTRCENYENHENHRLSLDNHKPK